MAAKRTVDAYVAALPDGQREIAAAASWSGRRGLVPQVPIRPFNSRIACVEVALAASRLFAQDFHVERAVKEKHEQAGSLRSGLVLHRFASREVGVRTRANNLAVGIEPPLQYDDRMGGSVPVNAASDAGRIADEIVLFARSRVFIEKP